MTEITAFHRITGGLLATVLTLAVGWASYQVANGALREDYTVDVVLGELGQALHTGNDVKMRGVRVGSVVGIRLTDELRAVATLELEDGQRIPADATFKVTGKTLLGEKQVEIIFDGELSAEREYLAAGTVVADHERVTEFEDVLATLAELMEGIAPEDLAVVVDEFVGAFDGMGDEIARSLDEGARAAQVFRGNLDDQIGNTRNLAALSDELAVRGEDFNRLGRATAAGMPTISENQAELRRLLDQLAEFARITDETLVVTRPEFDRMVIQGDPVLRLLFDYRVAFGDIFPTGLVRYGMNYDDRGFRQNIEAGQAAYFQLFIDQRKAFAELCANLPPELAESLPGCGASATQPRVPGGGQIELPDLPELPLSDAGGRVLEEIAQPDVPTRQPLDALVRGALTGGEVR